MLRKSFALLLLLTTGSLLAQAQSFALIDMDYILERIPAYQQAAQRLDNTAQKWQDEIDQLTQEAKALYDDYQATASSLTEAQRASKEQAIVDKEKQASELRRKYFGNEGEMTKLQDQLLTPIEDDIYDAVKAIAVSEGYAMVIDRASAGSIFFANPNIDISDKILKKLGY